MLSPFKHLKRAAVCVGGGTGWMQEHININPGRKQPERHWRCRKRPNCVDFVGHKDFLLHPRSKGKIFLLGDDVEWGCDMK